MTANGLRRNVLNLIEIEVETLYKNPDGKGLLRTAVVYTKKGPREIFHEDHEVERPAPRQQPVVRKQTGKHSSLWDDLGECSARKKNAVEPNITAEANS